VSPPHLKSPALPVPHGFFGRAGGVSEGMFASLNTGLGSSDDPLRVAENRNRCREALGAAHLLTLYQVHSPEVVVVTEHWAGAGPKADGMATKRKGVALGVLAADCMPFLFVDEAAGVIGAAHAGWRGTLAGVLGATVGAMKTLGARPQRIRAALGPCLRQPNFEVGLDVVEAFMAKHPNAEQFFAPGVSADKRQFDLAGFGRADLLRAGVDHLDDLGDCTLGEKSAYFSYRAGRRAGETDYGRNLSAIVLG
jgi:hypothetical protein